MRASAWLAWDVATVEVGVVRKSVVSRDSSEKCGCGALGSEEAMAVGCFQDAKKRSAGDHDSVSCLIDASKTATFVEGVRSVS